MEAKKSLTSCQCCGAPDPIPEPQTAIDEQARVRHYLRCARCQALLLAPQPSPEELAAYYAPAYYSASDSKFPVVFEKLITLYRRHRAKTLVDRVGAATTPRVLDIGCGSGIFLQAMAAHGYEAHGIELPGPAARRAGSIPEINLFCGSLDDYPSPAHSFTLVTMWHVLEHMPDPVKAIRHCHALLEPGGWLAIDVPNGDSWQARWFGPLWLHRDPPRHLVEFTPTSLQPLLEKAGFTQLEVDTLQEEMGWFGMIQSASNLLLKPRDALYNVIRSRGSLPENRAVRLLAILIGVAFAVPALLLTWAESLADRAAVVRVIARKPATSER
jgi:SAM-dependent methyltransferase